MNDITRLKTELRRAIDACGPDGRYDDAGFDRIHALIDALRPLNPTPRPIDAQAFVQSPWITLFAQFGARHSAGKPVRHLSSLKLQSFNCFPDLPVRVADITQEIRVEGAHYNNVIDLTTPDGRHRALLIIWGRYHIEPAAPQRYGVAFEAVELRPPQGVSAAMLRAQFGLEAGALLRHTLKPPRVHSDIVFCDDELRINMGSMGGVYVLARLAAPGKSVSFAPAPGAGGPRARQSYLLR
jgi:hypothetical protein